MLKMYVQNKPLFIVNTIDAEIEEYSRRPDTVFVKECTTAAVSAMLKDLEGPSFKAGVILNKNISEAFQAVRSHLKLIVAAGGLVYTPDTDLLLIHRKGKWDLPKGKLDEGEELEACAIREIEEETGAGQLYIDRPLHISYHTYYEKKAHILKECHWYLVQAAQKTALNPQTEEDITACEWVPMADLTNYYTNMHASVIDVLHKAELMLRR